MYWSWSFIIICIIQPCSSSPLPLLANGLGQTLYVQPQLAFILGCGPHLEANCGLETVHHGRNPYVCECFPTAVCCMPLGVRGRGCFKGLLKDGSIEKLHPVFVSQIQSHGYVHSTNKGNPKGSTIRCGWRHVKPSHRKLVRTVHSFPHSRRYPCVSQQQHGISSLARIWETFLGKRSASPLTPSRPLSPSAVCREGT